MLALNFGIKRTRKTPTLDGIPGRKVLFRRRVAWRPALESLDHQWVQVNHGHVVLVHIQYALSRNTRRQRRYRRKRSSLRHLVRHPDNT